MPAGLIEGLYAFKSSFPLLFELGKIGGGIGAACAVAYKIFHARRRSLDAQRDGAVAELRTVEREESEHKAAIASFKAQAETAETETRKLLKRSAEALLQDAEREREQGNHERAARLLADWHKSESPGIAEAALHLASWHDEILKQRTGDYDQKLTVERLRSLAELAAPDVAKAREDGHV